MIPDNPQIYQVNSTNKFLIAPFQLPDNRSEATELIDYELGGIAIQDPSQGLRYQEWEGWWDPIDSTVYLMPENTPVPLPLFIQPGVIEFCFTFDQNMRWSTATRTVDNTLYHRWYDASIAGYVTSTYAGVTSVRLALDDKRDIQTLLGNSDIILTYVKANSVHWRIQRDRFLTEYTQPGFAVPADMRITHFGMNKLNRLQWRVGVRRII